MGVIYVNGGYKSSQSLVLAQQTKMQDEILDVVEDLIVNGGGGSVDNELVIQLQTNIEELSIKSETLTSQLLVLQGDESVEGSVDYKINNAFRWKDLN